MRAFDLESKLFVQRNARLVVSIDLKLDALGVEPVLGQAHQRRHEFGADPLTLEVDTHRHAEARRVGEAAMPVDRSDIAGISAVQLGDQSMYIRLDVFQPVLPDIQ